MQTNSRDTIKMITDTLQPFFAERHFILKKHCYFELCQENGYTYQYEIVLSKQKGYYALSLRLNLLNDSIMQSVNNILHSVLHDTRYQYPANWTTKDIEKTITLRVKNKTVSSVSDWRMFKDENESLQDFRERFSIWMCVFDHLNDIPCWKEQLIKSVDLSLNWFNQASNDEWVSNNTMYPALVLLNKDNQENLIKKYNSLLKITRNTAELSLFLEHLSA